MAFWDIFKRRKKDPFRTEVRSIVTNLYGGNFQYFVWNYANQIYNIPEVRTAIEKIADIFSSMEKYNIRVDKDDNIQYLTDTTHRILNYQPNPLQNATQFYKNVITQLLMENNAFVEPIFDSRSGNLKALYPLPFKRFELETDSSATIGYVQFYDSQKNPAKKYRLDDIIYLSRFCTLSGGLSSNLGLYETVLKSLGEQIVNSASPNKPRAILQSNQVGQGQLKDRDKKGAMESVRANFAENIQGVAYLDKMWTITPINWNENDVNQKLMQMVINIVYNYFGINENIISGKATEIEMAMFINTTIKPLARQFEQEFTNKLYTENEFYFGRRIVFDYHPLLITTMQSRTSYYQVALRNGINNIDEIREMEGFGTLPNGKGKIYRTSADLVNVEIVDDYELRKVSQLNNESLTENSNIELQQEQNFVDS